MTGARRGWVAGLIGAATLLALAGPASGAPPDPPHDLAVRIDSARLDRHLTSTFVKPGQSITIEAVSPPGGAHLRLESPNDALKIRPAGKAAWRVAAPGQPGVYPLMMRADSPAPSRRINLFVMQPFDAGQTTLDGYEIGAYPARARHGQSIYAPPDALMPVSPQTIDARLSPHFTIGQFLCHQQPEHWPKYVRLRPRLVAKLEAVIDALAAQGIKVDTLDVMSGYRTPQYNRDIGNTTTFSRHLYGGAADIFVDTDHDGRMDDLNGDGTIDIDDARWLADLIESMDQARPRFVGGLSAYPETTAHGPFVHTDVRGVAVRW